MDELLCLNMNIVRPETDAKNLPVMVWIHGEYSFCHSTNVPVAKCLKGGGFALGSHTETVYDGGEFVKASIEAGTPVIYVAIQYVLLCESKSAATESKTNSYRVGFFGFLGSSKLQAGDKRAAVGNYGKIKPTIRNYYNANNRKASGTKGWPFNLSINI